jgi:AraC-like DNA-binding protein
MMQLTTVDWKTLYEQAEGQGETLRQQTPLGVMHHLPRYLGDGSEHLIPLRGGLAIAVRRGKLKRAFRYISEHDSTFPLVAKFYLAGGSRVQTLDVDDVPSDYEETNGSHYLYHLPNLAEVEEWPADELLYVVYVLVAPSYFEGFEVCQTALSPVLQRLFQGDTDHRFHQSLGLIPPTIHQVLQQIVHCPYNGMMQQLYLESKALELLTLQFASWAEQPRRRQEVTLRSPDIDQLHQAREILIQQAAQPPSLAALARQVGLNDRKLKQGFRQLFGTTVFGYLQNYRLEQAQRLLKDADRTVAQVALQVGYTNPEAFSTAFRRKFAVSPKAYQLGRRC